MKVQCYAIFDSCSGIYEKPFFSTTDDLVRREFQDAATAAECPISKHPEHYSLWRLASFDNCTGKITDEPNECLWQAIEAISQSQNIDPSQIDLLNTKIQAAKNLNGEPSMSNEEIIEVLADNLSPGGTD